MDEAGGGILLGQIDPGKITDSQRTMLIDIAVSSYERVSEEKTRDGKASDTGMER